MQANVPKPVVLKDILDAMEMSSDQMCAYVDPETGSVVTISDDEEALLESVPLPPDAPMWQQDVVSALQDVDRDRLLALPDRYEIHEWQIMKDFALAQTDEDCQQELLDALHGAGAFRSFRHTTDRMNLREAWHTFRLAAFERIARDWLEFHNLRWT